MKSIQAIIRTLIFGSLALTCLQGTAWAEYKPVDVSDIQGEQRKQLTELVRNVGKMPAQSRDAFLCEQLGLCFATDGSKVMWKGPGTNSSKAFFVGRSGRPLPFAQATKASPVWSKCYEANCQINQTKPGAIFSFFKKDVDRVVHNTAKYLMNEMPDDLRWSLLAMLDRKLYYQDGRSASEKKYEFSLECGIKVSYYGEESFQNSYFVGANGEEAKVGDTRRKEGRWERYFRWYNIVVRCANLVGDKDILALFPEEVKAMRKHYKQRLAQVNEQKGEANAEGIEALRRMSVALRRAWLAENMGFCYTQSDAPAYLAPHVANDNALFVDEQGKERKLSEVATDKMASDWVAATKAALAVGHEQIAAPFKEELKTLAVQTATYILNAIGETPRYSWLAEMNHLIFNPNGQSAYPPDERIWSVESGFKVQSSGVSYAKNKNMFYNPQGKITQPSAGNTGGSRWPMLYLYRCANVAGIEAINAAFKADVDAMRAAYEKSPFYKK